jgi:precorrin-6A/cobalt-precorrin-6A reductase
MHTELGSARVPRARLAGETPALQLLILGGTKDARELAALLTEQGVPVTTSLAGATEAPQIPAGGIRFGGFGGAEGIAIYCRDAGITLIADATHPFAARISANAHAAAARLGLPYLRLERPAWSAQPGDRWIGVGNISEAAAAILAGSRVFLTTGRKDLAPFFARSDLTGLVRSIEPLDVAVPAGWAVLRDRPPYSFEGEVGLMRREAITVLVTKNAGGEQTVAKLHAARDLRLPVIMIARPAKPGAAAASTAAELAALILRDHA